MNRQTEIREKLYKKEKHMKSLRLRSMGRDFINTTYDISLDSRTSRRCSKRILSDGTFLGLDRGDRVRDDRPIDLM